MKEGRNAEYPEKTPDDELQKMSHTKAKKFKPQPRLELALKHWWQARKTGVLTMSPRVAPVTRDVSSGVHIVTQGMSCVLRGLVVCLWLISLQSACVVTEGSPAYFGCV